MTGFEDFLTEKGYIAFEFNCKSMTYVKCSNSFFSSMGKISNGYIHKDETELLKAIELNIPVTSSEFPIRKNKVIVFGLHEKDKPPTLISPRPNILIERNKLDGEKEFITQVSDDAMNSVLMMLPFERILEAMFDKTITLKLVFA